MSLSDKIDVWKDGTTETMIMTKHVKEFIEKLKEEIFATHRIMNEPLIDSIIDELAGEDLI